MDGSVGAVDCRPPVEGGESGERYAKRPTRSPVRAAARACASRAGRRGSLLTECVSDRGPAPWRRAPSSSTDAHSGNRTVVSLACGARCSRSGRTAASPRRCWWSIEEGSFPSIRASRMRLPHRSSPTISPRSERCSSASLATRARVFVSTLYSYPQITHSLLLAHDLTPEMFGWNLHAPVWRDKRKAIRRASAFACVSNNTAARPAPPVSRNGDTSDHARHARRVRGLQPRPASGRRRTSRQTRTARDVLRVRRISRRSQERRARLRCARSPSGAARLRAVVRRRRGRTRAGLPGACWRRRP